MKLPFFDEPKLPSDAQDIADTYREPQPLAQRMDRKMRDLRDSIYNALGDYQSGTQLVKYFASGKLLRDVSMATEKLSTMDRTLSYITREYVEPWSLKARVNEVQCQMRAEMASHAQTKTDLLKRIRDLEVRLETAWHDQSTAEQALARHKARQTPKRKRAAKQNSPELT